MSTIASTLLDFILDLFRDPAKAAAFEADPEGALEAAGLGDTTPQQVADLVPMVADYATVGGWGGGDHGHGDHDGGGHDRDERDHDRGGHHRDDEDGRGRDCDDDHDRGGHDRDGDRDHDRDHERGGHHRDDDHHEGGHHHRPADDEDEDHHHGGGVSPVDRDECDDEEEGHSGGGHHHHAPAHAGGTETVVITHLQEVHYSHTETNIEIDASHSIWVSGDAQAIFGDVEGDVTQIDNEGGIVAGDDVEDSSVDNSDNSVEDSYNTDVDVRDNNLVITEGDGNTVAVDSEDVGNTDVDVRDNNLVIGDENTVVSGDGNAVGNEVHTDNSRTDNSVEVEFDDAIVQTGDGTVVNDSTDVGNTTTETTVEDNNLVYAGDDAIVDSEVSDSQNEDNDGFDSVDSFNGNDLSSTDNSVNESFNGNDLSDDDVIVKDNEVAIGGENANTGYQEDTANEGSYNELELSTEETYVDVHADEVEELTAG